MFVLASFSIEKLKYRFLLRCMLNDCGHDLEKCFPKPWRTTFWDILRFLDLKVSAWYGGASTPANAIRDCLRSNRRTSPISAMSCAVVISPAPYMACAVLCLKPQLIL